MTFNLFIFIDSHCVRVILIIFCFCLFCSQIVNGDPFYEPVEEDVEEYKELDLRASKLRKVTRKRKGLQVDEEVVVHAEKQRTLNKKK